MTSPYSLSYRDDKKWGCSLVSLIRNTAQFLDIPLDLTLTDAQFEATYLGEKEENVGIQLLAVFEGAPTLPEMSCLSEKGCSVPPKSL